MIDISGLRTHILIGSLEIVRCSKLWIESKRHSFLPRAGVTLPDPNGEIRSAVSKGMPIEIRLSYRNQTPIPWKGEVAWMRPGQTRDQIEIGAVYESKPLATTQICQAWIDETPEAIIKYAIGLSGLPLGRIDSPGVVIPRFSAWTINPWQIAEQAAHSVEKAHALDMSKWALWFGRNGVNWGDFDEPGEVPSFETGGALISNGPADDANGLCRLETWLLPGFHHSRRFYLTDKIRDVCGTFRAQRVRHEVEKHQARTYIYYGLEVAEYGRF